MARRLARLKRKRTIEGKGDDYLEGLLDDALDCFLERTHRVNDPGERIDGLLCELALHWSNMEGAEHTTGATEAEISRTWEHMPADLWERMKPYRLVVGINAEYDG